MSEAFKCDACGEYTNGFPSVEIDVNPEVRNLSGELYFKGGESVKWTWSDTFLDLCPSCGIAVVKAVNEVLINE